MHLFVMDLYFLLEWFLKFLSIYYLLDGRGLWGKRDTFPPLAWQIERDIFQLYPSLTVNQSWWRKVVENVNKIAD